MAVVAVAGFCRWSAYGCGFRAKHAPQGGQGHGSPRLQGAHLWQPKSKSGASPHSAGCFKQVQTPHGSVSIVPCSASKSRAKDGYRTNPKAVGVFAWPAGPLPWPYGPGPPQLMRSRLRFTQQSLILELLEAMLADWVLKARPHVTVNYHRGSRAAVAQATSTPQPQIEFTLF